MVTQERIKEFLEYRDGGLFWKVKKKNSVANVGDRFGSCRKDGYREGTFDFKRWLEHRLVFFYHNGYLPKTLDHINGNPSDHRLENLREATMSENQFNKKRSKANTSGHVGVCFVKEKQKYKVAIKVQNKNKHIGYFDDFELACLVSDEARDKYHGNFSYLQRGGNGN